MLMNYEITTVMINAYGNKDLAVNELKKSIKLYWRSRSNFIARSRIKSAAKLIREITGRHKGAIRKCCENCWPANCKITGY